MLENFFQLDPVPSNQIIGWYDYRLVILSYIVATFASYIALDIASRLRDFSNTSLTINLWLFGGSIAMGAGIWSMHFIGMLAFNMEMPMFYELSWTILSMLVAVAASWFALYLLKARVISKLKFILGGVILGLAIAAMHYTGMTAMTANMNIHYLPSLFILSILIAIFASEVALWLALKSTQVVPSVKLRLKVVSAFIMGAAICGMHYTGMFAAVFTPKDNMDMIAATIHPQILAVSVASVTFIILGVAFVVSTYKESINQQLLLNARQAGMAEVAASVLHNVGNVLNSVNVSSLILSETITKSKLSRLKDLNSLINEHKHDFFRFIQEDKRGAQLPDFINSLTEYWIAEQKKLSSETQTIIKNVQHIRNIIATQQDLSRISGAEQVVSIENILEEATLISEIENTKYVIQVEKKYIALKPILVDKVKLLQILVNLIKNAKDSVFESKNPCKKITYEITKNEEFFFIKVSDNGIGIPKENLIKIFSYGFTTKKMGHGFGLHTSAISATEMGGELKAISDGGGTGATFILKLPCKER